MPLTDRVDASYYMVFLPLASATGNYDGIECFGRCGKSGYHAAARIGQNAKIDGLGSSRCNEAMQHRGVGIINLTVYKRLTWTQDLVAR